MNQGRIEQFVRSVGQWIAKGVPVVSKESFVERMEKCEKCPSFDEEAFGGSGKCKECGCSIVKFYFATSSCPLGKWEKTVP